MNILVIGILVMAVIAGIFLISKSKNNNIGLWCVYAIGALFLIAGIYLFPALSWRIISICALIIGGVIEVTAVVAAVYKKNQVNN